MRYSKLKIWYCAGAVSWNSSTMASGYWSTMRWRRAAPFSPASASCSRCSMSAKPNWRDWRFNWSMRRAMAAAACRCSLCASGVMAASARPSSSVCSKHSGTCAVKLLANASSMPNGVNRSQALAVMAGCSSSGSCAQRRKPSNHFARFSGFILTPLKHLGLTARWSLIQAAMRSTRSTQPAFRPASCAASARCSRPISADSASSCAMPMMSARRASSRAPFLSASTSGQQSSSTSSACGDSGYTCWRQ